MKKYSLPSSSHSRGALVVAEIERAYVSGYFFRSSFISVPFPEPENPDTTVKIPLFFIFLFLLYKYTAFLSDFPAYFFAVFRYLSFHLLNILDLFPYFLNLGFQTDCMIGDFQIICL